MQLVFYLTPHQWSIDAAGTTQHMSIQQLFPILKGAKKKREYLRTNDCKIGG